MTHLAIREVCTLLDTVGDIKGHRVIYNNCLRTRWPKAYYSGSELVQHLSSSL